MTSIPVDDAFTADDLDSLPDDGQRYELVDGTVLVTPSPTARHQTAVTELLFRLRSAAPVAMRVFAAPLDVRLSPRLQVQPDLLVVGDVDPEATRVETVPLLVVEILSPSTRSRDLLTKRRAYEVAGIPSYWVVDPQVPSLVVLELVDGAYVETVVTGGETFAATAPFPLRVVPADLVR